MTSKSLPKEPGGFSGYRWTYHSSQQEGPRRARTDQFLETVDWHSLQQYAAKKHDGVACKVLPEIGLGGVHVVRIIEFDNGIRWIARLRLPPFDSSDGVGNSPTMMELREQSEYTTMSLVRKMTNIPIPEVHAVETSKHNSSGAPFMLMDCLPGNVGIDLSMEVPSAYNQKFIHDLAKIHVSCRGALQIRSALILDRSSCPRYGFPRSGRSSGRIRRHVPTRSNQRHRRPVRHSDRVLQSMGSECQIRSDRRKTPSSIWTIRRRNRVCRCDISDID